MNTIYRYHRPRKMTVVHTVLATLLQRTIVLYMTNNNVHVITNNENGIIDRLLEIYECGNDKPAVITRFL